MSETLQLANPAPLTTLSDDEILFRDNVLIFDTSDFKLVEKIELAKPQYPGMERVGIGASNDPPGSSRPRQAHPDLLTRLRRGRCDCA